MQVNTKSRAKRMRIAEEELKLPAAVDIAAAPAREKDWANVLTAHANEPAASTWQITRYKYVEQPLKILSCWTQDLGSSAPCASSGVLCLISMECYCLISGCILNF